MINIYLYEEFRAPITAPFAVICLSIFDSIYKISLS